MEAFKKMSICLNQRGLFILQDPPMYANSAKALYGLKQAPRAWFDKLRTTLPNWGFNNSMSDTFLFYTHKDGRMLLLLVYVDDILTTGESFVDVQQVIKDLNLQSALKTLGSVNYFLDFEITHTSSSLHLS